MNCYWTRTIHPIEFELLALFSTDHSDWICDLNESIMRERNTKNCVACIKTTIAVSNDVNNQSIAGRQAFIRSQNKLFILKFMKWNEILFNKKPNIALHLYHKNSGIYGTCSHMFKLDNAISYRHWMIHHKFHTNFIQFFSSHHFT